MIEFQGKEWTRIYLKNKRLFPKPQNFEKVKSVFENRLSEMNSLVVVVVEITYITENSDFNFLFSISDLLRNCVGIQCLCNVQGLILVTWPLSVARQSWEKERRSKTWQRAFEKWQNVRPQPFDIIKNWRRPPWPSLGLKLPRTEGKAEAVLIPFEMTYLLDICDPRLEQK